VSAIAVKGRQEALESALSVRLLADRLLLTVPMRAGAIDSTDATFVVLPVRTESPPSEGLHGGEPHGYRRRTFTLEEQVRKTTRSTLAILSTVTALVATCLQGVPASAATQTSPITYVYDELGRLEAVVDPSAASNQIAKFNYDAVGNFIQITRTGITTTPSVIDFHSHRAAIGQTVTVYGTAFSATPSQNKVTFTGAAAVDAVTSTTTTLTVLVPAAATAGPIKVKNTATNKTSPLSSQSWSPPTPAPTIATINGSSGNVIANPGDTITVVGTGFGSTVDDVTVRVAGIAARVMTASGNQLTFQVPAIAGSGEVTIRTAAGAVESAKDLILPEDCNLQSSTPCPQQTWHVVKRAASGAVTTAAFTAGQYQALLLIQVTQGQTIGTSYTTSGNVDPQFVRQTLFDPWGRRADLYDEAHQSFRPASYTGTYALAIGRFDIFGQPITSGTGQIDLTVQLKNLAEGGQVNPNPSVTVTIPRTKQQSSRFTFNATEGRNYCIDTSWSIWNLWRTVVFRPSFPDGEPGGKGTGFATSQGDILFEAPETGTYVVELRTADKSGFGNNTNDDVAIVTDLGNGTNCSSQVQSTDVETEPTPPVDGLLEAYAGEGPPAFQPDSQDSEDWAVERDTSPFEELPLLEADAEDTAVAGRVLVINGRPLPGVKVTSGSSEAFTDDAGRFVLTGLEAGRVVLTVDARSTGLGARSFGIYQIGADAVEDVTTPLDHTIWLTAIDQSSVVHIDSYPLPERLVITSDEMPGFEVHIPRGATIVDSEGQEVHDITLTQLPVDRPPFPDPELNPLMMRYTLQPGDATVAGGYRVIYANNAGLPPGFTGRTFEYEPEEGWEDYGTATVSNNGQQVVPEPGAHFGGFQGAGFTPFLGRVADAACEAVGGTALTEPSITGESCSFDPVNLNNGLFHYSMTDLVVPGTPSIEVRRVFQQNDAMTYSFGLGMASSYDILVTTPDSSQEVVMGIPGQARVHFTPVNGAGTGFPMFADSGPSQWLGAILTRDSENSLQLTARRRDGMRYLFGHGTGGAEGWLVGITDTFGNEIAITRTLTGQIMSVISLPSGHWIKFTRNANGLVTSVTDQSGRTVSYTYENQDAGTGPRRLLTVTDPSQQGLPSPAKTVYAWSTDTSFCNTGAPCTPSPATYLTDVFDRRQNSAQPLVPHELHQTYDVQGRVHDQQFADSSTQTFDYASADVSCLGGTMTDLPTGSSTCVMFAGGKTSSVTTAVGTALERTRAYTYGAEGLRTRVDDTFDAHGSPNTRSTTYTYDGLGNLTRVRTAPGDPDQADWLMDYNVGFNRVTKITDPLLHERRFTYEKGRTCLTRIEAHSNDGLTLTCTATGLVKTIVNDLGSAPTTTFNYSSGDLTKVTDPIGNVTSRFVGTDGSPRAITDPVGYLTTLKYDVLGQLIKVNPVIGSSTSFQYDVEQNLTRITLDATGSFTQYVYNDLNLVSARTDPLSRQETFAYDPGGALKSWTDRRGKVTRYCMDAGGNVERIVYGFTSGTPCTGTFSNMTDFTYDGAGRLEEVVDSASGTITRAFDDLDRLTNETTPQGSLTYTYDAANRRTKLAVAGQPDITYTYFTDDQLKTITRGTNVVTFAYDVADRLDTTTLPNGVVEDWTYNQANQTNGVSWAKAGQASLGALSYGNDAAGKSTTVWGASSRITLPAATTANATYDAASQLKTWNGQNLSYDQDGNLTAHGTQTYTFDDRNHLSATSGGTSSFAYDGLGRRSGKTVSGFTTRYLYDGANVVQELDGTNTPTFNLLTGFGPDEVYWRQGVSGSATVTNSLLHDRLGSTVATTTPAATPVVRDAFTYEPFGKPNSTAFPYLFTGRDYDTATGLQYNRARFMAPAYSRFTAEDPIGIVGGSANPYPYAGNAATAFRDPFGLTPGDCLFHLAGGCIDRSEGWTLFVDVLAFTLSAAAFVAFVYSSPLAVPLFMFAGAVSLGGFLQAQYVAWQTSGIAATDVGTGLGTNAAGTLLGKTSYVLGPFADLWQIIWDLTHAVED